MPKTLTDLFFSDGDTVIDDGHQYRVRLHPAEPDSKGRPQVKITVAALCNDDSIGYEDWAYTDDEPSAIHDEVCDLIEDVYGEYWASKDERQEREQAVHPFTGEPYS